MFGFRGLLYWRKIILCVDLVFLLLDDLISSKQYIKIHSVPHVEHIKSPL
jgi:hypothetical protein